MCVIAQKQMCEMANQRARQQTRTHLGILSIDSERQAHGGTAEKNCWSSKVCGHRGGVMESKGRERVRQES